MIESLLNRPPIFSYFRSFGTYLQFGSLLQCHISNLYVVVMRKAISGDGLNEKFCFVFNKIFYSEFNYIVTKEKIIKKANKFFSIKFLSVPFHLEKQNKKQVISLIISC